MPPVVGDSWGCRKVGVYGCDALENFYSFFVRNAAIEYNARYTTEDFKDSSVRAIIMKSKGELVGKGGRLDLD